MTIFALLICTKVIWQSFLVHNQKVPTSFSFCGTEPTPQSKRRSQGHRHFIHQASFFDTKETFDTQKPFKSSDFYRHFAFGRKCGCVSIKTFPLFVWMPKKPNPLGFWKIWAFFHQPLFSPSFHVGGRSMVALRCAPPRWRAWPEPTKWWQVPPSSGHRIWGGPLGRVVMGLGAC